MGQEFLIADGQKGLVEFQKEKIQTLFDVRIALADRRPKYVGIQDYADSITGSGTIGSRNGNRNTMVEITGQNPEMCAEAMAYIVSLTQKEQHYPADYLDTIEKEISSLEDHSGASISRPQRDKLLFVGSREQITLALYLVDQTSNKVNMYDLKVRLHLPEDVMGSNQLLPGLSSHIANEIETLPLPEVKLPRTDHSKTTLIGGTGVMGMTGDNFKGWAVVNSDRDSVKRAQTDLEPNRSSSSYSNIYQHMVKLGYKSEEVAAVLRKFGENATMDNVLNSLVMQKDSSDPRILSSYNEGQEPPIVVEEEEIDDNDSSNLKSIMIDGSNVAMSYGRNIHFDCRGIKIVVDFFLKRGHLKVYAFVPQYRRERNKADPTISPEILDELEANGNITFTPSRRVRTRRIVSYDDRYILDAAVGFDGVVVSNDHFRDFLELEDGKYKKIIEEQLLMYTFVEDLFMPTQDPLGRHGPALNDFLKKKPSRKTQLQRCPYAARCTFGNHCRYDHPEKRADSRPVSERLQEIAREKLGYLDKSDGGSKCVTAPLPGNSKNSYASNVSQVAQSGSHTSPLPNVPRSRVNPLRNDVFYPPYVPSRPWTPNSSQEMDLHRQMEKLRLGGNARQTPSAVYAPYNPQIPSSPHNSGNSIGFNSGYQPPSPYSSPNNTGYLGMQDNTFQGDVQDMHQFSTQQMDTALISRGTKVPPSLHNGRSTQSGPMNHSTFPFMNNHARPSTTDHNVYNATTGILPSSYQSYPYHQQQQQRNNLAMASDPSNFRMPPSIQRSYSVQEGNSLQQTRLNIFKNLSRSYDKNLVQYVMNMYPQEDKVENLIHLLNRQMLSQFGNYRQ